MHQDQRIGFALGVLLVGACAAFFFRNETRTAQTAPRLQHAQELDDRIAERSTRPYLKGIEAIEAADRKRESSSEDHLDPNASQGAPHWSPLDPPDPKFSPGKTAGARKPRGKILDVDGEIQESAPIAIPNDDSVVGVRNRASESTARTGEIKSERASDKSVATSSEGRIHVVQKGESLSSIAAKTLGNPNRFHELFEANRDQLKDPNDVKLGMSLRIPDRNADTASKSTSPNLRTVTEQELPLVESHPKQSDPAIGSDQPNIEIELLPPRIETSAIPKKEKTDSSSIPIPGELVPSEVLPESPVEHNTPVEESLPIKKFVPARRVPIPSRQIGPQATTGQHSLGGRKLSQVTLESTSGKIAR